MADSKLDLLQGTLDLMVLQTLETMGALHGYGVARRIEQLSQDQVLLNQGTIYASLVRLQQRGSRLQSPEFIVGGSSHALRAHSLHRRDGS